MFFLQRNRKSQDGERPGEEGEEEMMLMVRGASPSRLEEEIEKWDAREGKHFVVLSVIQNFARDYVYTYMLG